jgi:hypothetical protein
VKTEDRLQRIKELIQEYADIREDLDIDKVVAEIDELYSSSNCEPSYHHLKNILGLEAIVRSSKP